MDVMISLHCASSDKIARGLNGFLRGKGYSTWICLEMQGGAIYREEIVVNASGCKAMIILMNVKWAESKECRYEFNIALRSQLTKGFPQIIPIMMESFDFNAYPLITGVMANTNAIFYNPKDPQATWASVIASLSAVVTPGSADVAVPAIVSELKLPENISEWETEHVAQWFQSLKLPNSSKDIFESNWVDGPILLELKEDEMKESMKLTSLQSKRLAREINKLVLDSSPAPAITPRSSAVQSKDLQSTKGFATGLWDGWYAYPNGQRDSTSMDVTMIAGVVAGYGTDVTGDFHVQGVYDDDQLTISWDKTYIGAHVVYYKGILNVETKTIEGNWEISEAWNGKFALTYAPKPEPPAPVSRVESTKSSTVSTPTTPTSSATASSTQASKVVRQTINRPKTGKLVPISKPSAKASA